MALAACVYVAPPPVYTYYNPNDPAARAVAGAAVGAGAGAALGGMAGGGQGAAIGALTGGALGAAVGAETAPDDSYYGYGYPPGY